MKALSSYEKAKILAPHNFDTSGFKGTSHTNSDSKWETESFFSANFIAE
jgi:hypothetical protein